ncbi:MAG: phenylalanine--tRNA ligase subunit beta [Pelagibacteraceae bacterium]
MKLTLSWLKKHLNTKAKLNEVTEGLTNIGLEVEEIIKPDDNLKLFKVAKILKAEKHPNADKLKVCDVDIGGQVVNVVCGASNARENLLTVYAPPGATIPKNGMKLVVAKIRGVESRGMLCSDSELGISQESEGIAELKNKKVGESFFQTNDEETIDISITPNRSDCLGIKGIARDLCAYGLGKIIEKKKLKLKINSKKKTDVKIEKNSGCEAFGSLYIESVKNCESPSWLKKDLESLGLKPISAIVDVTNYVMFDLNRPMHAYDADKIDKKIIVRSANKNEVFDALDDKQYKVTEGSCLITDESKILGLGGIIGGKSSSINFDTKNIVLEAAAFDPVQIAKTSKELNIITDAKFRFERGVDLNSIQEGLELAAKLITDICGGKISKINIVGKIKTEKKKIIFNTSNFKKLIGFSVSTKDCEKILKNLGFNFKTKKNIIALEVPSWRPDISQEADIIEEILRIKGLDNVQSVKPDSNFSKPTLTYNQKLFHLAQRSFASQGFMETVSWSFTDGKYNELFGKKNVKITNPISSDLDTLRSSNFVNLLNQSKNNIDRSIENFSLFEIGPVFQENFSQKTIASGVMIGKKVSSSWIQQDKSFDIYDAKEKLFYILSDLGLSIDRLYIEKSNQKFYHPGQSGDIFIGNNKGPLVGSFGSLHPLIINKMNIEKAKPIGLEVYIDNFIEPKKLNRISKKQLEKSSFQTVERDFAFIFDDKIQAQNLILEVKKIDQKLIKSVDIFDVYIGEKVGQGKKSIAMKVVMEPFDKTLTEKEIEELSNKIIESVSSLGGVIRSQ